MKVGNHRRVGRACVIVAEERKVVLVRHDIARVVFHFQGCNRLFTPNSGIVIEEE